MESYENLLNRYLNEIGTDSIDRMLSDVQFITLNDLIKFAGNIDPAICQLSFDLFKKRLIDFKQALNEAGQNFTGNKNYPYYTR